MDCPSARCAHLAPAIPFHWPGPSGLVVLCSILIVAWAGRLGRVWLGGWGSLPQTGGWEEACPDTEPLCLPDQQGSWCGISGRFFSPLSFFFYLRRIIALSRGSQDSKSLCRTAGQPRDVPLDQPLLPFLLLEAWEEHPYREGEAGYCSRLPVLPVGRES